MKCKYLVFGAACASSLYLGAITTKVNGVTWTWMFTADGTASLGGWTPSKQVEGYNIDFTFDGKVAIKTGFERALKQTGQTLVIPSSIAGYPVTHIGPLAFALCNNLRSVTIPNTVKGIGEGAFVGCRNLESVIIPNSVTKIGLKAFGRCSSLPRMTIPDSVTSIGKSTFYDCESLTSVTISDSVTNIGEYAFSGCSSLTSVTIPSSVARIGSDAFRRCESLVSLTIQNGVTHIESSAFEHCSSLLGDLIIPDSVRFIGSFAFRDCSGLRRVVASKNHTMVIGTEAFDGTAIIDTHPDGLVTIGSAAYRMKGACPANYTIPTGITSISEGAFRGHSELTSVTIPDSVEVIGGYVFANCNNLNSVTLGKNVTLVDSWAFSAQGGEERPPLKEIIFLGNKPELTFSTLGICGISSSSCQIFISPSSTGWDGWPVKPLQ